MRKCDSCGIRLDEFGVPTTKSLRVAARHFGGCPVVEASPIIRDVATRAMASKPLFKALSAIFMELIAAGEAKAEGGSLARRRRRG